MKPSALQQDAERLRAKVQHLSALLSLIDRDLPDVSDPGIRARIEKQQAISRVKRLQLEKDLNVVETALEAERLLSQESYDNNLTVTKAQKRRRGEAIARGKAKHPVAIAVVASEYASATAYARRRLRISQGAFSKYILGKLDCPPEVADAVRADFGLGDGVWVRPPRR